jgi:hypothetical protein
MCCKWVLALALLAFLGFSGKSLSLETGQTAIREPVVAGKFYPLEAGKLEGAVKGFLEDALPARGEKPIAVVVPHAGYIFSGQIAADAYKQAMGNGWDVVVVLGTNHTLAGFEGIHVYQGAGFKTPLGVIQCDQALAKALLETAPGAASRPEIEMKEHSVEVQVPFIQAAFPKAKLLAAVVATEDPTLLGRFGQALAKLLAGRKALIVASSDLSHYPSREDAPAVDRKTLRAIASMDPASLTATVASSMESRTPNLGTCACGEGAIIAAMAAAKALGATHGAVLSYANSGDTTVGEPGRVVGYGAVAFFSGPGATDASAIEPMPPAPQSAPLTDGDKAYLLSLARKTLSRYLLTETVPLPRAVTPGLRQRRGAFVTWTEHGELRGCIGRMVADEPLALTISRMALEAGLNDPRFAPVKSSELPLLKAEISVLTPFAPIASPSQIRIGVDGVLLQKGGASAVFLPQVAPEQGWGREELLNNLCRKAGLSGDCWQSGAKLSTFQAIVFSEEKER